MREKGINPFYFYYFFVSPAFSQRPFPGTACSNFLPHPTRGDGYPLDISKYDVHEALLLGLGFPLLGWSPDGMVTDCCDVATSSMIPYSTEALLPHSECSLPLGLTFHGRHCHAYVSLKGFAEGRWK